MIPASSSRDYAKASVGDTRGVATLQRLPRWRDLRDGDTAMLPPASFPPLRSLLAGDHCRPLRSISLAGLELGFLVLDSSSGTGDLIWFGQLANS
jgi:hypothetical protein